MLLLQAGNLVEGNEKGGIPMQDEKVKANEPLSDEQMEAVSGGEIGLTVHFYTEAELTCTCGRTFYLPYHPDGEYQCPFCRATIMK